jgi:lysophospholipase L1-like esterase
VAIAVSALSTFALAEDRGERWVAAWQGSPTPGGTFYSPGCPSDVGLTSQTVRNIVYISAGGEAVRVRISNAGGANPLKVGSASVAISAGGATTVSGSLHVLQFAGQSSILIAAGGVVVSDPVAFTVEALHELVVSVFLPGSTGPTTQHYFAAQTNYLASGDQTAVEGAAPFTHRISCWMFVSSVDVKTSPRVIGNLVALGDSITDGYLSTTNANRRYPDFLARKLAARNGVTMAVGNAGIIGNELLTIRPQLQFGYPTPARLDRDTLLQTAARAVILLEGINDIGDKSAKAEDLIPVDLQLILAAHAAGLRIYGGTLLPFCGSNAVYGGDYGTAAGETERVKLNDWIRTSGAFNGVIDFDAALRDPANPTCLLKAYDGDHLHPNDAGYQAMANTVDLDEIIGDVLRTSGSDR